jgi:MULE transposase domain
MQEALDFINNFTGHGYGIFNHEAGEDHVVHTLSCTHKTSLDNLRLNSYVPFIDCTYKTNQYPMPHLDITGLTACISFYVGLRLQATNAGVLQVCFEESRGHLSPAQPSFSEVHSTNKDKALLKAICEVFPQTYSMLCHWHINKTFLRRCVRSFEKKLLEFLLVIVLRINASL